MAQRRMFSPDIVGSDAFLEMPTSSRELYFQLGMSADDDGFVNPKKIMRIVGASEDDLKVLLGKRFLLHFKSGVVVIKHWLIHNMIRKDRYHETKYLEEKRALDIKENGSYTELATIRQPNGNQMATEVRLGKVRLEKTEASLSYLKQIPEADLKEFVDRFDCSASAIRSKAEDLENYCKSKGKVYKDYKAFLLNALKKDFKPRIKELVVPKRDVEPMSSEERERVRNLFQGISKNVIKTLNK